MRERGTRVILERMENDIKVIAEQYGSVYRKLEEHDIRFDKIDQRFDRLEMVVIDNRSEIKKLKIGQNRLEQKVDQKYSELKIGQHRIEQKLDGIAANHENRLQKLESK